MAMRGVQKTGARRLRGRPSGYAVGVSSRLGDAALESWSVRRRPGTRPRADPRDAALAAKAFGSNGLRLARLKRRMDPSNILAYACPLPKIPRAPQTILLVTGSSGAGKDYSAHVWAAILNRKGHTARVESISDATKREYAAATGADVGRLLGDRTYKEQHRPALTAYFQEQVRQRPRLPEDNFLHVVYGAEDVDVLLITGMREEAPVAVLSHLVPESRMLDVHVQARQRTRQSDHDHHDHDGSGPGSNSNSNLNSNFNFNFNFNSTALNYSPSFTFDNETPGKDEAERFAQRHLLPFFDEGLHRLGDMVRTVPDFPRPGTDFRHILNIPQQPGGLALCTSLLQAHFTDDWANVDAIVCCEAGGFVFASALASRVQVSLLLIREAGKLPPPTIAVEKPQSYVSSLASNHSRGSRIEMEQDVVPRGASVVVVDDVLSTGTTLRAMLQLLNEAGIGAAHINIMVVAEFPAHAGRNLLHRSGFGKIKIQSLLTLSGA
ncbi:phosphoribosyltransferase-like protein [Dendryphion nanum]|uniref:adenine phosphoribosyltransferase n=1 Tax=Dendryphion nanum TaxID=256645 RepID=A0A9P9D166_9PLEO|nr:phosphoribosyltransferase-like protein [Dendryphion nanum]